MFSKDLAFAKVLALLLPVAVAGCPKQTVPTIEAGPAPSASAAEVDADLPWANEIVVDAAATASANPAGGSAPGTAPAHVASAAPAPAYTGPSGTFSGRVKDSGDVYTLTVELGPNGGSASYGPPLNCKGRWTSTSHNDKTHRYVERINHDPGKKCTPVVDVTLEKDGARPDAFWYSAGAGQARALITKQ